MTMHSYLWIDGVAGGSGDSGYEGWIDCDSVSWSLRGPGQAGVLSEIRFVKPEDAASPLLARLCVSAARMPAARFEFVRTHEDGARVKCYEIALDDVVVALVATGPRRESALMESVVLAFSHARLTSFDGSAPPDGNA